MQQYIGFKVSSSEYMIPILKVREIISMPQVTALPQLPPYVKGVTNIRGTIIPIITLKSLLDASAGDETGNTVIVLVAGKVTFGIVVDGITGVIKADESQIEPPESFFSSNVENIEGVAKLDDKLIVLLDAKKLLPLDDLSLLEDAIVDVKEMDDGDDVEIHREVETIGGKVTIKELHNAKEFFSNKLEAGDPKNRLFDQMLNFMNALASQEYQKVDTIIDQLVKDSDSDLFNEVGKITRKLHDSLEDFKGSLDNGLQRLTKDDVPNAIDKLQFVITKTEDAANRTMGIVERYFEESDDFSKYVNSIKDHDEAVAYLRTFKDSLDNDMTSILTAQQFQDITGQTIKKVIHLVNHVEEELLSLITKFGMPVAGNADKRSEKGDATTDSALSPEFCVDPVEKVSQSDVEGLLNDFGF